jgi:hypothetical protein
MESSGKRKFDAIGPSESATDADRAEGGGAWVKRFSNTYKRDYWFNELTGASTWIDPMVSSHEDLKESSEPQTLRLSAQGVSSTDTPAIAKNISLVTSAERSWIEDMTNPKLSWRNITDASLPGKSFVLFDDAQCIGGTKQRLLGRLAGEVSQKEIVYAGPGTGYAQVALGYAAALWKKKGVIFLNGSPNDMQLPLVRMARGLGVDIRCDSSGYCTLESAERNAAAYVAEDPTCRYLAPFGLRTARGQFTFELLRKSLLESTRAYPEIPKRLWLVAGSGFILDVLHSIWPTTKYMVVQVGKKVWREVLDGKDYELFIAPERFGDDAELQPPYASVPWYDAKLWQFVRRHGRDGDCIWNVAAVPADPETAAQEALERIARTRPEGMQ